MSLEYYKNKKLSIIHGPMNLIEGEIVTFLIRVSKSSLKNDPSEVALTKVGILAEKKPYKKGKIRISFKTEGLTFHGIYNPETLNGEFLNVE